MSPNPESSRALTGAGDLSIILAGPVYRRNVFDVASHCKHFKEMFPVAQLILSISISDLVEDPDDAQPALRIRSGVENVDELVRMSLKVIERTCDHITFAEPTLPLPSLKFGGASNNVNLALGAAKAGFAIATGRYALRIRNDMIFVDRSFVDFYFEQYKYGPDRPTAFAQRVMVPPIWTLNPYTIERSPFHIGDLFHFGLTDDLRALWNMPEMSYADATFYETHPHLPTSSPREREFRPRLAVEQHIHFPYLKTKLGGLTLDRHNDLTSAEEYLRILAREFLVCDFGRCIFHLKERQSIQRWHVTLLACITHSDWRAIIDHPKHRPVKELFGERIRESEKYLWFEQHPRIRARLRQISDLARRLKRAFSM